MTNEDLSIRHLFAKSHRGDAALGLDQARRSRGRAREGNVSMKTIKMKRIAAMVLLGAFSCSSGSSDDPSGSGTGGLFDRHHEDRRVLVTRSSASSGARARAEAEAEARARAALMEYWRLGRIIRSARLRTAEEPGPRARRRNEPVQLLHPRASRRCRIFLEITQIPWRDLTYGESGAGAGLRGAGKILAPQGVAEQQGMPSNAKVWRARSWASPTR